MAAGSRHLLLAEQVDEHGLRLLKFGRAAEPSAVVASSGPGVDAPGSGRSRGASGGQSNRKMGSGRANPFPLGTSRTRYFATGRDRETPRSQNTIWGSPASRLT